MPFNSVPRLRKEPMSTEEYLRGVFQAQENSRKNRDYTPRTFQPDGSMDTEDFLREVVFGVERPPAWTARSARADPVSDAPKPAPQRSDSRTSGTSDSDVQTTGAQPTDSENFEAIVGRIRKQAAALFPDADFLKRENAGASSGKHVVKTLEDHPDDDSDRPKKGALRTMESRPARDPNFKLVNPGDATSAPPASPQHLQSPPAGAETNGAAGTPTANDAQGPSFWDQRRRDFGIGVRGLADSWLGLGDTVVAPARVAMNLVNGGLGVDRKYSRFMPGVGMTFFAGGLGGDPNYFRPLAGSIPDDILPQPETPQEHLGYNINAALGTLPVSIAAGNAIVAQGVRKAIPTVTQALGRLFAAEPAAQVASGLGSAVALTGAQAAGLGPVAQTVAGLAGGVAVPGRPGVKTGVWRKTLLEEAPQVFKTTNHETGITGLPKANRAIMESPAWTKAKGGNPQAAEQIIEQIWTPQQTQQLQAKLQPGKEIVCLSVPSTSGNNAIPEALGQKLAQELGGTYLDVKQVYKVHTKRPMKELPKSERPFAERSHELLDANAVAALKDKQVILTEDVITTGSSARRFALELRRQGVEVQTVAGLMGSGRLDAPPQLVSSLQRTLRNAGMPVKGRELADILSAGEIETIIESINTSGGAHARRELTERIQGLLNTRTTGSVAKHPR